MAKINLLPKSLAPKGGINKISKNLKTINLIGTIVFLFLAVILLGLVFLNSRTVKSLNASQDKLKNSIKSMQQVEQQYVLVKNRLALIKEDRDTGDLGESLTTFEKFVSLIPSGVALEDAMISSKKVETQLLVPNSDTLISTFSNLSSTKLYSKLIISALLLKQGKGYQVGLEMYQD